MAICPDQLKSELCTWTIWGIYAFQKGSSFRTLPQKRSRAPAAEDPCPMHLLLLQTTTQTSPARTGDQIATNYLAMDDPLGLPAYAVSLT